MPKEPPSNLEFVYKENSAELLKLAQAELKQVFVEHQDLAKLVLVSGGSAWDLLQADFGEVLAGSKSRLTIGVLDERFSQDPKENNFAQLMETNFFKQAVEAGASTIDTRVKTAETPPDLANRFEKSLKQWKATNPTGVIIITQGMGSDAHTAGMMPFADDGDTFNQLFQSGNWVTAYDAGGRDSRGLNLRVTTSMTFLVQVNYSLVWILGENKKDALAKLLDVSQAEEVAVAPIRIIYKIPRVTVFTDQPF